MGATVLRLSIRLLVLVAILHIAGFSAAQAVSNRTLRLTLVDGTTQQTDLNQIKDGSVLVPGLDAPFSLDDFQRIELAGAKMQPLEQPAAILELHQGRLLAKSLKEIKNDACAVDWLNKETAAILLDGVRGIRLAPDHAHPEFDKALAAPHAELDLVFLRDENDAIVSLAGLIESLDDRVLKIDVRGQVRELPRRKLYGVVMAQPPATEQQPKCTLTLVDGSKLAGDLSFGRESLGLRLLKANEVEIPWVSVVSIDIRSSRVQYLSDLKPVAEEQTAIVTLSLPAQRDKTAVGGPLVLKDVSYRKGLGVHALSRLTYAVGGKWDTLTAAIGLDPQRGEKGDCVFKVFADGDELYSKRMRGTDAPENLSLDISGRQQITLLVEPGEGLDLADHANWCDARLIKENRQK